MVYTKDIDFVEIANLILIFIIGIAFITFLEFLNLFPKTLRKQSWPKETSSLLENMASSVRSHLVVHKYA